MTKKEFKLKWENYWYHYKWHTWVAIFVIVLIFYTVFEFTQTAKKDVTITYMGSYADYEGIALSIEENFHDVIEDVDKDGKKKVYSLSIINTSGDALSGDLLYWQRADLNFVNAESYLYFVDESVYEILKERKVLGKIKTADGESDYIDVTGNKYFSEYIYGEEKLYLCVRNDFAGKIEEEKQKNEDMSKKILEKILENN